MVSPLGSIAATPGTPAARPAGGGLDAQLAHYQVLLSDWVHCPFCDTPEGKARIAALTDKVTQIEQQIQARDRTRQAPPAAPGPSAPAGPAGPLGTRLDVYV